MLWAIARDPETEDACLALLLDPFRFASKIVLATEAMYEHSTGLKKVCGTLLAYPPAEIYCKANSN